MSKSKCSFCPAVNWAYGFCWGCLQKLEAERPDLLEQIKNGNDFHAAHTTALDYLHAQAGQPSLFEEVAP